MPRTLDRHPGPFTEDEEIRLQSNATGPTQAGAFNYNGTNFVFRDSAGTFDPRFSGQKVRWVTEGGTYSTLQDAIDAAAVNDVILVAPRASGTWGDITIPAQKKLSILGLAGCRAPTVAVGKVTFAPTSGLNILENEVYLQNLFITGSFVGAQGLSFGGTAPARLRLQGCYIYNTGASGNGVVSNNSGQGSSLYLDNCVVGTGSTSGIAINHVQGYTLIKNNCDIFGHQYQLQCAAGTVEVYLSFLTGTLANEVVRVSGGLVTVGYSTVKNTTANATGVNITAAGAAFGMGDATFAIGTGTGYCVTGVSGGVYLYGRVTYSNSVAAGYNVKVKNTLTAVAVAQSFTSSQ